MLVSESPPFTIQELQSIPLFAGLSTDALEAVVRAARRCQISAGDRFFLQGDPATTLHVLVQGQVRLTQVTPDGQQVIMRLAGPNQMFGGIAAIGSAEYPASAEALVPSEALTWESERLEPLFDRFPRLARNMMALMAEQILELQNRLREMATERVERRIARTLLRLIRHAGRKVDDGVLIDLPFTRQDLAEMTGTTLYTVSRTLSRWETEGITKNDRQQVVVRIPHKLVVIAEDLPPVADEDGRTP
jgi:CRP/FNR family transcriptional regulator, nitrogen oxide reductase regulator